MTGSDAGFVIVRGGLAGGTSDLRKNSPPAKFSSDPLFGVEFTAISNE